MTQIRINDNEQLYYWHPRSNPRDWFIEACKKLKIII
jgi:hypothetical protein